VKLSLVDSQICNHLVDAKLKDAVNRMVGVISDRVNELVQNHALQDTIPAIAVLFPASQHIVWT
jgi:hypothetical protein